MKVSQCESVLIKSLDEQVLGWGFFEDYKITQVEKFLLSQQLNLKLEQVNALKNFT